MRATRRGFLLGAAAASLASADVAAVRAAATESRFVLIFLRGAMDGLNVGHALWRREPGDVAAGAGAAGAWAGERAGWTLAGFWGLHPALKTMHSLYAANDLLPIQCVAGPEPQPQPFRSARYDGDRR